MMAKLDLQGFAEITHAVSVMLNELGEMLGIKILFEELGKTSGVCFSNETGSLVMEEKETIIGGYVRTCSYPFYVVFRCANPSSKEKQRANQILDCIGRWMTGEVVEVDGSVNQVHIPVLKNGLKITKISVSNHYGLEPMENGVQDWLLPVVVEYEQRKDE